MWKKFAHDNALLDKRRNVTVNSFYISYSIVKNGNDKMITNEIVLTVLPKKINMYMYIESYIQFALKIGLVPYFFCIQWYFTSNARDWQLG